MDASKLRDEQALRYRNGDLPPEEEAADLELPLVCKDCGMKFESKKEFATHVTKVSAIRKASLYLLSFLC